MRSTLRKSPAFTLAEMLVAMSVLTLLVLSLTQLVNHTASITTLGNKRMDAESEIRPLFQRMALDFAQLVKRSDVSFYLKTATTPMAGNDLLGFYSTVQGYYPTTPSPVSVVAYRVNSDPSNLVARNSLERMGKGLDWNGASPASFPVVFLPLTIDGTWPSVASSSIYDDPDPGRRTYEIIGPHVFRFEYHYLERQTGNLVAYPAGWTSLSAVAVRDVAAIVVTIAIIDPTSRVLISNSEIAALGARLPDYASGWGPGELRSQWQAALDATTNLPRPALSSIRLYERTFPVSDR